MTVISLLLIRAHAHHTQTLPRLGQSGSRGRIGNLTRVQIVDPLLQRCLGYAVEIIHPQDVVFRIELAHFLDTERLSLERRKTEDVTQVDAPELRLAMVDRINATAQGEINDVDAVDLAHPMVTLAAVDILRDEL